MHGRDHGKQFEEVFIKQAASNGLYCKKNPLACRHVWNGRLQLIPGNLDFTLANDKGSVGFFDAKSFDGDRFKFSAINEDQLSLAKTYEDWKIRSGFVIYLRDLDVVSWFTASQILEVGSGNSLTPENGKVLGTIMYFDLKRLLR